MTVKVEYACDGCGRVYAVQPLMKQSRQFLRPPDWREVAIAGQTFDACSAGCVDRIIARQAGGTKR